MNLSNNRDIGLLCILRAPAIRSLSPQYERQSKLVILRHQQVTLHCGLNDNTIESVVYHRTSRSRVLENGLFLQPKANGKPLDTFPQHSGTFHTAT